MLTHQVHGLISLAHAPASKRAEPITENASVPVLEDSPGVVDLVSRQQELGLLRQAIRTLPERCQHVFLLRKIHGLSHREIATRLGISDNTVETLVGKGTCQGALA